MNRYLDSSYAQPVAQEGSHSGLAFSLSKLLAQKMAGNRLSPPSLSPKGKKKQSVQAQEERPAFLVSRCPRDTMARLDTEGGCFWCVLPFLSFSHSLPFFPVPVAKPRIAVSNDSLRVHSGKLDSPLSTTCEGSDENDRRTVCVEDLREDEPRIAQLEGKPDKGKGKKVERSGRRRATCGIGAFFSSLLPLSLFLDYIPLFSCTLPSNIRPSNSRPSLPDQSSPPSSSPSRRSAPLTTPESETQERATTRPSFVKTRRRRTRFVLASLCSPYRSRS